MWKVEKLLQLIQIQVQERKKQILKQNHFLTAPVWAAAEAKNIWNCMAKTCNEDV